MKKITLILIFSILFCSFSEANAYAATSQHSWYIKRNGTNQPILQEDQKFIYNYNAYFIDKKLSDNSEAKRIYLTYDAGYENGNVEKTLDILKEANVKAAFFILDNIILKNPDLVTRMANEGHIVCNHTRNHKNLSNSSYEEIEKDLSSLERIYQEKTGLVLEKYFRFPEGKYSESALKAVSDLGYKTIFWSFAYDDWDNGRQKSPEKAIEKVLSNTHNGAVILFHPTSSTNVKILPTLIKEWRSMGYEFGTLDELVK